jgi:hypothetical protein
MLLASIDPASRSVSEPALAPTAQEREQSPTAGAPDVFAARSRPGPRLELGLPSFHLQGTPTYDGPVLALVSTENLSVSAAQRRRWVWTPGVVVDFETLIRLHSGFTLGVALDASVGAPRKTKGSSDAPVLPSVAAVLRALLAHYNPVATRRAHREARLALPVISLQLGWAL